MHPRLFCYTIETYRTYYKKESGRLTAIYYPLGLMKNYTKYLALALTTLLVAVFSGPVDAADTTPEFSRVSAVSNVPPISVPDSANLSFEKPTVSTAPATVVADSAPVALEIAPQSSPTQYQAPVAATPVQAPAPVPAPAPAVVATPVVTQAAATGSGSAIANAAFAQLGVAQDCTMLVTNSLRAVGINFHGAPAAYLSLGRVVSSPQAGDLIYYSNAGAGVPHVAVYVGNGQAVHGGWNGGTTAVFSANLGSGPVYIRVA